MEEEQDLFRSEKLSKAVEQLAEAVIITDPGGNITYVNPAFEAISGYTADEALGRNPRILKSGQCPPEMYKSMWETLSRGEVWRGSVINRRKNGSTYHARLTISPIRTHTGRVINYVAVQYEITTQLELEKQARLRSEEYRVLHEVAKALHKSGSMEEMIQDALNVLITFNELQVEQKAGVFLADEENRVLKLFSTVGEFSQEFLEKEKQIPYGNCLCGRAAVSHDFLISDSCFTDERHENKFEGMTAHGHYIVPLLSREKLVGVLFLYTDEKPPWYERSREILLSIGGLIADAIEHRRIEDQIHRRNEELAAANTKLKDLNELKNKFLGIASHDLRNPLYLIRSFSEAMLAGEVGDINEKQKSFLQKMFSSSNFMTDLLNNLLDYSRIESGRIELDIKTQDFNQTISQQVEVGQFIAKKKNIRLQMELGNVPDIPFDKHALVQVVNNYISNAIKFSPPGSQIHIATELQNGNVKCSVKDEGPGISEEDQKLLFGEFQTLSAKPTGGEKSTGLGLAIVKKIVTLHGGKVWVHSTLGKGTTFFFTLPVQGN